MDFEKAQSALKDHGTQEGLRAAWVTMQHDLRGWSDEDRRRITAVKDVWKAWLESPDDWVDRWYRGEE